MHIYKILLSGVTLYCFPVLSTAEIFSADSQYRQNFYSVIIITEQNFYMQKITLHAWFGDAKREIATWQISVSMNMQLRKKTSRNGDPSSLVICQLIFKLPKFTVTTAGILLVLVYAVYCFSVHTQCIWESLASNWQTSLCFEFI